jgi:anti-sigma factor RsiW
MRCEQARQLFDAYLNGELSPSLTTELGAHRVRCPDCRRALALLEVTGHIVASDRDPVTLDVGFTNRLIACMESPQPRWTVRFRRSLYIAGPLAAAAVIALAFLGVFDRPDGKVLGERGLGDRPRVVENVRPADKAPDEGALEEGDYNERAERLLAAWIEQTQENMEAKRQSGESLQKAFGLTVRQLLDILKQAEQASQSEGNTVGDDVADPLVPPETTPSGSDEVEDL